ncbi:hypothetical protein [Thiothrix nivea]|uniref:Uncharacterized protein n=1 Tax=Thiothrix nivea (strain ATCC 35100 / DSM 5205 / JP2) TaxID=870187 RepID=A0A656HDV8_THINJ|nr:hypothetical protein [Thiothrix nivea]EIJ33369.1 hypothetical protein Thini_0732 [Thiothrix nivea DSM 5205]
MFVVFKNGVVLLETADYQHACSEARKDALKHRLSSYSVWDKATANRPVRDSQDKPLYQINAGITYTIPNPPNRKEAV